jgi:hypothetical protein
MEPPVNRLADPGSKKGGASSRKKGTHPWEVFWTLRSRNFRYRSDRLKRRSRSEFLALVELSLCADIRLAIKQ